MYLRDEWRNKKDRQQVFLLGSIPIVFAKEGEKTMTSVGPNSSTPVTLYVGLVSAMAIALLLVVRQLRRHTAPAPAVIILALYILVLGEQTVVTGVSPQIPVEVLAPFRSFFYAIRFNIPYLYLHFLLSMLLFVPLGILVPVIDARCRSYARIALLAAAVAGAMILLKLAVGETPRRYVFDLLFCNIAGAVLGYTGFHLVMLLRVKPVAAVPCASCLFILVGYVLFFCRPLLLFPTDLTMTDSSFGLPYGVSAEKQLRATTPKALPVISIPADRARMQTAATEYGLYAADVAPSLGSVVGTVQPCSVDEALRRADTGAFVSFYAPATQPFCVAVTKAEIQYMENRSGSCLVPVWSMEGQLMDCEGNSIFDISADEEKLIPLTGQFIVPA